MVHHQAGEAVRDRRQRAPRADPQVQPADQAMAALAVARALDVVHAGPWIGGVVRDLAGASDRRAAGLGTCCRAQHPQ